MEKNLIPNNFWTFKASLVNRFNSGNGMFSVIFAPWPKLCFHVSGIFSPFFGIFFIGNISAL
jgi:hypothetical protein